MTKIIRSTPLQHIAAITLMVAAFLVLAPILAQAAELNRQLQFGMTGTDVSTLQSFLAEDTSIYPQGLVTGYFGTMTRSAVSNYQSRNGIDVVGRVGPITLASINAQMAGGSGSPGADVYAPILSAVNVNTARTSANISWTTNEPTKGVVYYSTGVMSESEGRVVTIGGTPAMNDGALHSSHNITISGLQPATTYYYDVYVTDANGNASMTMQTTFRTTN
jgi:peptidoglycan hydrolase-like protein with peptidoglycan-binding domain